MKTALFSRRWFVAIVFPLLALQLAADEKAGGLRSPNQRIHVIFEFNAAGEPGYSVTLDGKPVLQSSKPGLVRDDADFTKGLKLLSFGKIEPVKDRYEILTARGKLRKGHRCRHAVDAWRGLVVSGAVSLGRHVVVDQRELATAQLLRHAASARIARFRC